MNNKMDTVTEIRAFNRFYTEIIGLLGQHILDSGYSLTEARVLLEISRTKNAAAHKLADVLGVDRSYMSRIIAKFEKEGLITRQANKNDSRASDIRLTDEGRRVFRELDERSNCQIMQLVSGLGEEEQAQLRQAMKTIKKFLNTAPATLVIRPFRESDVEYVIERQLSLYETERGFSSDILKRYLREGVLTLIGRFNPELDNMYILENNGAPRAASRSHTPMRRPRSCAISLSNRSCADLGRGKNSLKRRSPFAAKGVTAARSCGRSAPRRRQEAFTRQMASKSPRPEKTPNGASPYLRSAGIWICNDTWQQKG